MTAIIVKDYHFISKSFGGWDTPTGRLVKGKDHYDRLMKEQGMVPYEGDKKGPTRKEYSISEQSLAIIRDAKMAADRRGNVKLGDRAIKALIDRKAIGKKIPDYMKLPGVYK